MNQIEKITVFTEQRKKLLEIKEALEKGPSVVGTLPDSNKRVELNLGGHCVKLTPKSYSYISLLFLEGVKYEIYQIEKYLNSLHETHTITRNS